MTTQTYRTNLRCSSCVESIRPGLDALPELKSWRVDLDQPGKPLSFEGQSGSADKVRLALKQAGYELLEEMQSPSFAPVAEPNPSYYPLLLVFGFLIAATLAVEISFDSFHWPRAMRHFMGGFFLVFSFFKLLDLRGFASTFIGYDLIAAQWFGYGYVYPFLEFALGWLYLADVQPVLTNSATLILMSIGTAGVMQSILQKRAVRCACLGSVINLPVSTVTLIEDAGMAVMAALMLIKMGANVT